ncbi:hypothetical protein NMT12_40107 [metagenome]
MNTNKWELQTHSRYSKIVTNRVNDFMLFTRFTDFDALINLDLDEIESLIDSWRNHLKENNNPSTIEQKIDSIKTFYYINGIDLY